jgi:phosphate transport system permease protein
VISIAIVLALIEEAIRWLFDIQLGWLWTEGWIPRSNQFDLLTIFAGTVMVAVIAMLVAAPLGLGAAAYLSEYATPRTRRTLKPILETLASIPSVVLGYFALQVINPDLVRKIFTSAGTFNYLAAGLASGSSRSRWWPRWPRTRCTPSPTRFARVRTGSAPGA